MVEYPSSDGVKANDSICSASRVTRKGPRSISRSRVENDCFPRTPSGSLPRPPDLNKKASGSVSEWPISPKPPIQPSICLDECLALIPLVIASC